MPALSFTLERKIVWILDPCRDGEGQSIRPKGKRKYRVGDRLYLYAHQRTKNCRKLGEAVCSEVIPIIITPANVQKACLGIYKFKRGDYRKIELKEAYKIAENDGFGKYNYGEFSEFFIKQYRLSPLINKKMVIIKWKDFKPEPI